jgi:predicted CopG family antitoxin
MQNIQELRKSNIKNKQPQLHIAISHENHEKLKRLGTCGMSFNDVLTKILAKQ